MITLAAPFGRNPRASNMRWVYDLLTRNHADEIDDELVQRVRGSLPVLSTAVYSRMDGIIAWESCVEEDICDVNENIEVLGSHSGLGFNVEALYVIANRLAQPEGAWKKMGSARSSARPTRVQSMA